MRKASVECALEAMTGIDAIYRRNVGTLQRPGLAGWRTLQRGDG